MTWQQQSGQMNEELGQPDVSLCHSRESLSCTGCLSLNVIPALQKPKVQGTYKCVCETGLSLEHGKLSNCTRLFIAPCVTTSQFQQLHSEASVRKVWFLDALGRPLTVWTWSRSEYSLSWHASPSVSLMSTFSVHSASRFCFVFVFVSNSSNPK